MPYHNARHLPDGSDPITVKTGNLEDGAVTAAKLAPGAVSGLYYTELSTAGWEGLSAPFKQTLSMSYMHTGDTPMIDVLLSGIVTIDRQRLSDFSNIYRVITGNGSLTAYAFSKPTGAVPLRILNVRR